MCTVTYLPLAANRFVLTHSRDEKVNRPAALPPRPYRIGGQTVTYPHDPQGSGTWFATSAGLTACLLNGAFVAHTPKPPYKHSRGLVVLDVFNYVSVGAFSRHYPFTGLEPFTLLLAEAGRLTELRWDGKRLSVSDKDPQKPHIWSSATLYSPAISRQREGWFAHWCAQHSRWSAQGIRQFHLEAGANDPPNALRMNRHNQYLTVSLTSVVHDGQLPHLHYEDLTPAVLPQRGPVAVPAPPSPYQPIAIQPSSLRHAIA